MRYRWLLCLCLLLWLCGCGQPPLERGIKLQIVDGSLLSEIKHADIAFFASSVRCSQINPQNYKSVEAFNAQQRIALRSISFTSDDDRIARLDKLPQGEGLVVYIACQKNDATTDTKPTIAQGCRENVTLSVGQTTALELSVTKL